MSKKTFATFAFPFLLVSCGAVANSNQPINTLPEIEDTTTTTEPECVGICEPAIVVDKNPTPERNTQVTISEQERYENLGWCHFKGIIIANGSFEAEVGEGTTEIGLVPCRPFEVEVIDPPTVPQNYSLPETE